MISNFYGGTKPEQLAFVVICRFSRGERVSGWVAGFATELENGSEGVVGKR